MPRLLIGFLVVISHLTFEVQSQAPGIPLLATAGSCLTRNGNCIFIVLCNATLSVLSINITNPLSICLQGQAYARVAFGLPPQVQLSITNVTSSPPGVNGTGYCNCYACPVSCIRGLNGCNENGTSPLNQTISLGPPGLIFEGNGNFCLTQSPDAQCLALVLCNLKAYVNGVEIQQGQLPPACASGVATFSPNLNVNNPFFLTLNNVSAQSPLSDGSCPCPSCHTKCINNPIVGCLSVGSTNTTTLRPTSPYSTSTSCPSCPNSSTKKPEQAQSSNTSSLLDGFFLSL